MTDKRSESQFTEEQQLNNKIAANENGFREGRYPGHSTLVKDIIASGEEYPVSGAALAKGKKQHKETSGRVQRNANRRAWKAGKMGGIIEKGKLVKGGNQHLAEDLSRGKK